MNKWLLIVNVCAVFILTSCVVASTSTSNPITEHDEDTPVTVLFSDADNPNHEQEANYYDALIELSSQYPDEMPELIIVDASEQDKVQYFDVQHFPTILCLDGDDISLRLEGMNNKEDILMKLSGLFQLDLKLG
ncbi:hypothetical protein [Alkalicoccobacillus porphyridii]|uniref:Small peptidoglycan-associated lipoprotein n=1 Tax=Alkalicoccobacillus porphyridii TaxID=2597270 RepID=A0A553ZV55_9BACI|nr:hypothetical protein [Alkalicoccobacillus porphyridii]TSB45303.1 hypothetical protein FN960_16510 [Alkalicoccobacillus porphyridii]